MNRVDFKPKRKTPAQTVHGDMDRIKSYVLHLARHVINVMGKTTLL